MLLMLNEGSNMEQLLSYTFYVTYIKYYPLLRLGRSMTPDCRKGNSGL